MMYFCTLFDSYYIHKGIALYLSLEKVTNDFHLYVMAFDRESYEKLRSIGFKRMTVELFEDIETKELLALKTTRTKAEYCWTCGPSVIYHFLTNYNLPNITYLDADLFFLSDPHIIQEEIGDQSVAISEQGGEERNIERYGRYCVQYVFFKNDINGIRALTWWRERCIEWCFSRYEDGKYGDQKYLDQFEVLFNNVHIIQNKGLVGPWDTQFYSFNENTLTCNGEEYPLVFFHMSGNKFELKNSKLCFSIVESGVTPDLLRLFYKPYAVLMKAIYTDYFGKDVESIEVRGGNPLYLLYKRMRGKFSNNRLAIFLYYKVFRSRYDGHEEAKTL